MNFRANLTQPNLFYQPIEPLFRSYLVPGCLIYVIVVPHESMDNYSTVAIYTFKISQHNTLPTIYQTWNMKPRHHFFSYFDYTLLAMFGNFIVAPADSIGQIRFMVQASMIVVFQIDETTPDVVWLNFAGRWGDMVNRQSTTPANFHDVCNVVHCICITMMMITSDGPINK